MRIKKRGEERSFRKLIFDRTDDRDLFKEIKANIGINKFEQLLTIREEHWQIYREICEQLYEVIEAKL